MYYSKFKKHLYFLQMFVYNPPSVCKRSSAPGGDHVSRMPWGAIVTSAAQGVNTRTGLGEQGWTSSSERLHQHLTSHQQFTIQSMFLPLFGPCSGNMVPNACE